MFLEMSPSYKHYMLQNLLVLKKLHDRGRAATLTCREVTVYEVLDLLFGRVKMEPAETVIPDIFVYPKPEEDSEEEMFLHHFKERPQFLVTITLPFTCTDAEAAELQAVLDKAVVKGEDVMYMSDIFLMEASVQGKSATMRVVDYHPETSVDDEPVDILFLMETLIEFWDKVTQIQERRRKKNGFDNRQIAC